MQAYRMCMFEREEIEQKASKIYFFTYKLRIWINNYTYKEEHA